MSCNTCNCGAGLSNTGTTCSPLMQVAKKIILVPIYDSTGTQNSINLASTLNAAYFNALVAQADKSKRWYPLPEIKNVEDVRAENRMETFADGSSVFISQGDRSFKGWLVKGTPGLISSIEAARCLEVGVYIVDKDGNLHGTQSGNYLYPIKLDEQSIAAKLVKTTDTTLQKVELTFNFHSDEKDENLRMISCNEIIGINLVTQLEGLKEAQVEYSSITTNSFVAELYVNDGISTTPVPIVGLVKADFSLFNDTDNGDEPINTVVESPDGTYTVTPTAPVTAGDVLYLTPTKTKYDFETVSETPIQVPLS